MYTSVTNRYMNLFMRCSQYYTVSQTGLDIELKRRCRRCVARPLALVALALCSARWRDDQVQALATKLFGRQRTRPGLTLPDCCCHRSCRDRDFRTVSDDGVKHHRSTSGLRTDQLGQPGGCGVSQRMHRILDGSSPRAPIVMVVQATGTLLSR